jgi:hypothetical protein
LISWSNVIVAGTIPSPVLDACRGKALGPFTCQLIDTAGFLRFPEQLISCRAQ